MSVLKFRKGLRVGRICNILDEIDKDKFTEIIPETKYSKEIRHKMYHEYKGGYLVPRFGNISRKRIELPEHKIKNDIKFMGQLRKNQELIVAEVVGEFENPDPYKGCIIHASTGIGKTVIMMYLISEYKNKTIFVVPSKTIADQTYKSCIKFIDGINVQRHYGKFKPDEEFDVLITTINMIRGKKDNPQPVSYFNDASMIIFDEVHKYTSDTNIRGIFFSGHKYILGASATPYEYDHNCWLPNLFGKFIVPSNIPGYIAEDKNFVGAYHIIKYIGDPKHTRWEMNKNGVPNHDYTSNLVYQDQCRKNLILRFVKRHENECGLLQCGTKEIVQDLYDLLKNDYDCYNSIDHSSEQLSEKKQIIIATYDKTSTGYDNQHLTWSLYVSPMGKGHDQNRGRLTRGYDFSKFRTIYDIYDVKVFKKSFEKRIESYKNHDKFKNLEFKTQTYYYLDLN